MENTNLEQVHQYVQRQRTLNQERLRKQDSTVSQTRPLWEERRADQNPEILDLGKTQANDAVEYVQMVKSLFTARAVRKTGSSREREVRRALRAATVDSPAGDELQTDAEDPSEEG